MPRRFSLVFFGGNGVRISGVGPDVPQVVNENGGAQSATPYRFDLLDPIVMFRLAKVIGLGAEKYGDDNWSRISVEDHLNHAVQHIYAWLAGDAQEDHLGHALCRVVLAAAVEQTEMNEHPADVFLAE